MLLLATQTIILLFSFHRITYPARYISLKVRKIIKQCGILPYLGQLIDVLIILHRVHFLDTFGEAIVFLSVIIQTRGYFR